MDSKVRRETFDLGLDPVPTKRVRKVRLVPGQRNVVLKTSADKDTTARYNLRAKLLNVMDDPKSNAQSKASAARTLAEIDGLIGRHQVAPDRGAVLPVSALSRAELEHELQRLRDKTKLKP